jgi:hypothetical protein
MSQANAPSPPEDDDASFEAEDDIQFDQAEYATPAPAGPTCGLCHQPITDAYYEIGGKVLCTTCRGRIEESFRGGSRLGRVLKAFVFGSAAALAGGALYYVIIETTGYNIGLIAILVGFMVGGAVKRGSGNRGGRFYQFLAVFLTYSSIVAMHVPYAIKGFRQAVQKAEQDKVAPAKNAADGAKAKAPAEGAKPADAPKAKADAPATALPAPDPKDKIARHDDKGGRNDINAPPQGGPPPSLAGILMSLLIFVALLIGILYSLPVQLAMMDPISGLIFSFALWEAWKITKKVQLSFNGPFRVATGPLNVPSPEEFDDGR